MIKEQQNKNIKTRKYFSRLIFFNVIQLKNIVLYEFKYINQIDIPVLYDPKYSYLQN